MKVAMKILTVAAILVGPFLAQAQMSLGGSEISSEVAPARVRAILQEMGFQATEKAGDNSTVFIFQLANYKTTLDSHQSFMELQLALSDKVNMSVMNEWNRTHRFTRAYKDSDGGSTLES